MKHLKTYEGFFDFFKKKNIIDEYTKDQISEMYQELSDDYDLKWDIIGACMSTSPIDLSSGLNSIDTNGKKFDLHRGTAFNNCYSIPLYIRYDQSEIDNLTEILKTKSDIYDIKYRIVVNKHINKITEVILFL